MRLMRPWARALGSQTSPPLAILTLETHVHEIAACIPQRHVFRGLDGAGALGLRGQ